MKNWSYVYKAILLLCFIFITIGFKIEATASVSSESIHLCENSQKKRQRRPDKRSPFYMKGGDYMFHFSLSEKSFQYLPR